MNVDGAILKEKIEEELVSNGLEIQDNKIVSKTLDHDQIQLLHRDAKINNLRKKKYFYIHYLNTIKSMTLNLEDIDINKITPVIKIITNKKDSDLFNWWNNIWWSLPFEKGVGRQIRYFIWDDYHDMPMGLIYLASPTINIKDINTYLELNHNNKLQIINRSMNILRLGALPPYNILLGGKLAALSVISNEIRDHYNNKYNCFSKNNLLFVTTTGAYGKSSILNRLKYKNIKLFEMIGYTSGCGTFHISNTLYEEMLEYARLNELKLHNGITSGSSNKIYNMCSVFRALGCPQYIYHNIKRSIYIQSYSDNLTNIIHNEQTPIYYNWCFEELYEYWRNRWLFNRLSNINPIKNKMIDDYFNKINDTLLEL